MNNPLLKNFIVPPYCKNVKNNAKTNIPIISKHQKALTIVDAMFTGIMLIISDTKLKVFSFLFSIMIYLISFFPNCLTAIASTSAKTSIATGRNGIIENVIVLDPSVKSCNEQDTKYPL